MPSDNALPPLVIFGCGYVGTRLARAALALGRPVRVCARGVARLEPLRELGAEVHYIDASRVKQFGPALTNTISPTVVYSIPPVPDMPAGEAIRRATQAALAHGARSFIYLGSAGVYGSRPPSDGDEWVDEETPVAHDDAQMAARLADEAAVETATSAGLRTVVLRLAAIYGPGRGVRQRLKKGDYKLIDEGSHWISRIHVDDIVQVILAADERAQPGALYLVADDRPTTQREYAEWLCARLGVPLPRSTPSYAPGASRTHLRGRRTKNERMKRDLGVTLRYPSFVEGEVAIEAEESGAIPPPPSRPEPAPVPVAAPAPVADAAPRPPFVRHVSALETDTDCRYPGSAELLANYTAIGKPLGLTQIGANVNTIAPGRRTSWPHAHSVEDELVYVLEGALDLWVDGALHRVGPGDVIGFPAGTGVAHTLINNGTGDARILVVSNRAPGRDQVFYPLHPARQHSLPDERRWDDPPARDRGPHDGLPDAQRANK